MKKAEAISILATSVRPREAKDRERYDKAVNMAIEALKSQELKNVPDTNVGDCPYCHEDSDGYVKPIEKNSHAFVRFGMDGWELSLKANGWHGEARIKFCPMCGRGLKHG